MGLFKKDGESNMTLEAAKAAAEGLAEGVKDSTSSKSKEEWVWVDGFKGTNKDMKCNDYQYEMGKCFDMPEGSNIELCSTGFHLCKDLTDVFKYYGIGNSHRFFAVKALVRKSDVDALGPRYVKSSYGVRYDGYNDKLVAKSIIFTRELTMDEILKGSRINDWTDEQKKLALEIGIREARNVIYAQKLVDVGYSETFAKTIVNAGRFDIAYSVGTQDGLSMDMKVWTIFNVSK